MKAKRPKVKAALVSAAAQLAQELARRLKIARTACGLSQDQVAKHFGISSRSVSQWEVGKAMPKAEKIKTLAEMYNVPMEWLWGEGEIPQGLPTIQRMSRKKGEEIREVFVSHRQAGWPQLQKVARSLTNPPDDPDDALQYQILNHIPAGNIQNLHQAATTHNEWLYPQILKDWHVDHRHVILVRISEDTNEPILRRGAYAMIDASVHEIRGSRNFYIFNIDGLANLIRRATPDNSRNKFGYLLSAANDAVAPMIVDREQLRILGRVVGVMNPL